MDINKIRLQLYEVLKSSKKTAKNTRNRLPYTQKFKENIKSKNTAGLNLVARGIKLKLK